jgi:hypothetical protein
MAATFTDQEAHVRFPTYSEATATLALFIALGGTSYAVTSLPASSVGSSQLKTGSVTAAKLHAHAVSAVAVALDSLTGKQIDEASLAEVPRAKVATSANTASSATTAISAASATTAKTADSATTAATAVTAATATNATMLGGAPPSSYHDSCPNGMHQTRDLCFDFVPRAAATFATALATCGAAGLRLPSLAEAIEAFNDLEASQVQQWTDAFFFNTTFSVADIGDDANRVPQFGTAAISNTFPYRCVATASD